VYARKRADLLATLNTSLSPLVLGQLKNLHKRGVATFRSSLLAKLKGDSYDFGAVVVQVSNQVEDDFVTAAKGMFCRGSSLIGILTELATQPSRRANAKGH
jgi:protein SEY1